MLVTKLSTSYWAVLVAAIVAGPVFAQTTYQMTELGSGSPQYLNDAGQVVMGGSCGGVFWSDGVPIGLPGCAGDREALNAHGQVAGGRGRAFLWDNGVTTDLGTLGGGESRGRGINDAGQVVGDATTSTGETHAFLWTDGVMVDLGTLGGVFSTARKVNNAGQVIGYYETAAGESRAFIWEDGVMQDLGTLGGTTSTYPFDINDKGQITGHSEDGAGRRRAFLWQNGAMTDIGAGGGNSFGYAINESSQIAGNVGVRPYLWTNGLWADLGNLGGDEFPWSNVPKQILNEAGHVTGQSRTSEGRYSAFIWDGFMMHNLNHLVDPPNYDFSEYILQEGIAVNNQGQILVRGYNFTARQTRTYLLTPIAIDTDEDGIGDDEDNCSLTANPNQIDTDSDGDGDACDMDDDDDGILDANDNCQLIVNPTQDDFDDDGAGDSCDFDADADEVLDAIDACLFTPIASTVNSDGCAIADLCPCSHPDGTDKWKNHGKYVSCVSRTADDFRDAGLINDSDHGYIVSEAGQSSCGVKY